MNNTINCCRYNSTFSSRYLNIHNSEKIPQKILDAIYKNDSIEEFLNAGKPKTLLGKFMNLFRKNEFLDVYYDSQKEENIDPYSIKATVHFFFGKNGKTKRFLPLDAFQFGVNRLDHSIPRDGEDVFYKKPLETVEDKLARQIDEIKDINRLLK